MSIDAGIFLRLEVGDANWQLRLLRALVHTGWRLDDCGRVVVLPLGDDGDYEWSTLDQSTDVWDLFAAKVSKEEAIGVVLSWGETGIGGTLEARPNGEVVFSAQMNRRCLDGMATTDVSWYLVRLLPAVVESSVVMTSWEWVESM